MFKSQMLASMYRMMYCIRVLGIYFLEIESWNVIHDDCQLLSSLITVEKKLLNQYFLSYSGQLCSTVS